MRFHLAALLALSVALALPASSAAYVGFVSPSRNIGCVMTKSGVRCDIAEHSWKAPPKPASCDVDWGSGLSVGKRGRAHFVCAGDTVLHAGKVLPYGDSVRRGRFRCKSKMIAIRCVNLRNGHGFALSREHAKRF